MEGIGSYVSIVGLNAVFAGDWVIIAMAITMDIAKIVTVSFLYQWWHDIKLAMKSYMAVAAVVLMTITSVGAYGYLSNAFQKAIAPTKEVAMKIETLTAEKTQLDKERDALVVRQKSIDDQVANLPPNFVTGRTRLLNSFKEDKKNIQGRLTVIDSRLLQVGSELTQQKSVSLERDTHVGPVVFVSKAFDVSVETAVKYVILLIILVFDPLAIMLVIAANFLIARLPSSLPPAPPPSSPPSSEPEPEPEPELDEPTSAITTEQNLQSMNDLVTKVEMARASEMPEILKSEPVAREPEKSEPPPEVLKPELIQKGAGNLRSLISAADMARLEAWVSPKEAPNPYEEKFK